MSDSVTSDAMGSNAAMDDSAPGHLDYVASVVSPPMDSPAFIACFSASAVVTDENDHIHSGHAAISAWYGSDYFTIQSHIEGHYVIVSQSGKNYELTIDGGPGIGSLTLTAVMVSTSATSKIQTMTLSGIAAG